MLTGAQMGEQIVSRITGTEEGRSHCRVYVCECRVESRREVAQIELALSMKFSNVIDAEFAYVIGASGPSLRQRANDVTIIADESGGALDKSL